MGRESEPSCMGAHSEDECRGCLWERERRYAKWVLTGRGRPRPERRGHDGR